VSPNVDCLVWSFGFEVEEAGLREINLVASAQRIRKHFWFYREAAHIDLCCPELMPL
jgi:hypothetical protein